MQAVHGFARPRNFDGLGIAFQQETIVREYAGPQLSPFFLIFTVPSKLELSNGRRRIHRNNAGLDHTGEGDLLGHLGIGARCIRQGKDLIAIMDGADCRESKADARNRPCNDEGLAAHIFDFFYKSRAFPPRQQKASLGASSTDPWRSTRRLAGARTMTGTKCSSSSCALPCMGSRA